MAKKQQTVFHEYLSEIRKLPKSIVILFTTSLLLGGIAIIGLLVIHSINQKLQVSVSTNDFVITKPTTSPVRLFVDIEGAVETPGVYEVTESSRLVDALKLAHGLSSQADRNYVAHTFNLAKKLQDEDKLYIPFIGETQDSDQTQQTTVNINTASRTELELLPGIGSVTTENIIDHRPYADVYELVTKKVVGQKIFDRIKNLVGI
ncbi:MAG: ComEA family DNA-binding protein [Patescibacteria group bacterium]|jgi:competence protein ComEA